MSAISYYIIPYNEAGETLDFNKYPFGEFPKNIEGCIYIFSKIVNDVIEHHQVGCTPRLRSIFDEENINERLAYYDANCLLIYECGDEDKMESIVVGIRYINNIPYNYRMGK